MNIIKGNTTNVYVLVKENGNVVTTLASASAITFMVKSDKRSPDSAALITKTLISGITVNTGPLGSTIGYLRITLSTSNTAIMAGDYYVAVQIKWGSNIYELVLREGSVSVDQMTVIQDTIRG